MAANTALLVMDVQAATLSRLPGGAEEYVSQLSRAIQSARTHQVPIVYVVVSFRPGYPEISPDSQFAYVKSSDAFITGSPETQIPTALTPQSHDIVVTKKRVSAFSGSDLGVILRSLKVTYLVLAGIATSGAVLSTVREAADLDFKITVLEDLCRDRDEEVQRVLMEKVFTRQASVMGWEKWVAGLGVEQ